MRARTSLFRVYRRKNFERIHCLRPRARRLSGVVKHLKSHTSRRLARLSLSFMVPIFSTRAELTSESSCADTSCWDGCQQGYRCGVRWVIILTAGAWVSEIRVCARRHSRCTEHGNERSRATVERGALSSQSIDKSTGARGVFFLCLLSRRCLPYDTYHDHLSSYLFWLALLVKEKCVPPPSFL